MSFNRFASTGPLTDAEVSKFKDVVHMIVNLEQRYESVEDYDGSLNLMQQLYSSIKPEDFEIFSQAIEAANDTDRRSPE